MELQGGQVIGGRYRLERPLASGGMGTVWVATHLQLDVPVALKFVSAELGADPMARVRFEREAKAAARLQSVHVVRTYDYGVERQTPFMAMELLEGESLESRLERVGVMSKDRAADLLRQVATGLAEAHDAGIVHRDLKPANLFLARAGRSELVKILDFGIAKETALPATDERTATGTLLGSPSHMSPEHARGGEVDARSDLWSLGVVMFRALTGVRPFDGAHVGELMAAIFVDPIPSPSRFDPTLRGAVDAFFARALARSPELRFQSALEMADAFDEAIGRSRPAPLDPTPPLGPLLPRAEETKPLSVVPAFDGDVTTTSSARDAGPVLPRRGTREWARRGAPMAVAFTLVGAAWLAWPRPQRVELLSEIPLATPARATEPAASAGPEGEAAVASAPSGPVEPTTSARPREALPRQRPQPAARPAGTSSARAKADDPFFD